MFRPYTGTLIASWPIGMGCNPTGNPCGICQAWGEDPIAPVQAPGVISVHANQTSFANRKANRNSTFNAVCVVATNRQSSPPNGAVQQSQAHKVTARCRFCHRASPARCAHVFHCIHNAGLFRLKSVTSAQPMQTTRRLGRWLWGVHPIYRSKRTRDTSPGWAARPARGKACAEKPAGPGMTA